MSSSTGNPKAYQTILIGTSPAYHGRWRWEQWKPMPALEGCSPGPCEPAQDADLCPPLPSWDKQMEQDRAQDVQSYNTELARASVGQPRGHCPADREHDYSFRSEDSGSTRHAKLRDRVDRQRRRTCSVEYQTSKIPRRLELRIVANQEQETVNLIWRAALAGPSPESPITHACTVGPQGRCTRFPVHMPQNMSCPYGI